MVRKIFKTGNSMVVSLPSEAEHRLGIRPGTEVDVRINDEEGVVIIRPVPQVQTDITPEFARLVDEFMTEYHDVLQALA